jgi:PKD repeat protein
VDSLIQKDYIVIGKPIQPSFTALSTTACAQSIVRFSGKAENAEKMEWEFGDGTKDTGTNPVHIYTKEGNYAVTLTAYYSGGCQQKITQNNYISVKGSLKARFNGSGIGCAPLRVQFRDSSQNAVSWLWEFGDGDSSREQYPVHVYNAAGKYEVTLHVYSATGCESILEKPGAAVVPQLAKAAFGVDKTKGCPPLTVSFKDASTGAARYAWDFGDGQTSSLQNPVHVYKINGKFTATLHVYNTAGCADTTLASQLITSKDPDVLYTTPKTIEGCPPFNTNFSDATIGSVSWLWNFGDGTFSTKQNPAHTYTATGLYTVTLTTITKDGCKQYFPIFQKIDVQDVKAGFIVNSTTCPPFITTFKDTSLNAASWYWDFGDGQTSTAQEPAHQYSSGGKYTISLTITSSGGCTNTTSQDVNFTPFSASFTPTTVPFSFPAKVSFNANSTNATAWHWDFGDSSTSDSKNPSHTYTTPGLYIVSLRISNAQCSMEYKQRLFDTISKDKHPVPPPPVEKLEAKFNTIAQRGCAPFVVNFRNTSTKAVSWHWDFGDGGTSTQANPIYSYINPGVYTVTLIAYDVRHRADTLIMHDAISATKPKSSFSLSQFSSKTSTTVLFSDSSKGATSWFWEFGDGVTSTLRNPSHIYPDSVKIYNVTLTITDSSGCSNSSSKIIYNGYDDPISGIRDLCIGEQASFSTSLKGYNEYLWNFGDGSTSALEAPVHAYSKGGNFAVSVKITDPQGNSYTSFGTDSLKVADPRAGFEHPSVQLVSCDTLTVHFKNTSSGASAWLWNFGDGESSTQKDAVHTFHKAGIFDVSLTAFSGKCKDVSIAPAAVKINKAEPQFNFSQDNVCLPIRAEFRDLSKKAVSWHWDFGDGQTSTARNPIHLYTTKPVSGVTLTITDSNGCTGSLQNPNISLLKSAFDASIKNGCGPLATVFKDQSANAVSWNWNFGDGQTSNEQNPSHIFTDNGSYTIRLVVKSASGCIDTFTAKNFISISRPKPEFVSEDKASCAPSYVRFTDQSTNASEWRWDFGDGSYSANSNPNHIYNLPGLYTVKLVVTNAQGCKDSIIKKDYVKVLGTITDFSASATQGCPPFSATFTDKSKDAVGWSWNFGDGSESKEQNPTHIFKDPGHFTVSLITYDVYGCSSVKKMEPDITVYDRDAPEASPIRSVSVTSNTSTELKWAQSLAQDFLAYRIYRQNNETREYELATTINDVYTTHFTDNGLNTLQETYTYKVQTVDQCGFALSLDSLIPHTTINVEATAEGHTIHVNWTPYKGGSISSYQLYRIEKDGDPLMIATLNPDVLTYTDSGLYCPYPYTYRIKATEICGNPYESFSDTSIATPENIYREQRVNVVRTTVIENTRVLTEWQAPELLADKVTGYKLYKSIGSGPYQLIATLDPNATEYIDDSVDVNKTSYQYRVDAMNSCGADVKKGRQGTSIVLKAKKNGDVVNLKWNGYEGWNRGVDYYIIERLNENGQWEFVKKVPSDQLEYDDR